MARYRKIDPRIWNDEKFRTMTHESQRLFLFVLTHPALTMIGAMRATKSGLMEELGLDTKGFREAFGEALAKGMLKYDEKAFLLWLPNFLKYNSPESPNVVKSWDSALDLLPECELRNEVLLSAKAFISTMSKAFAEALPKAFEEALSKAMPKTMPNQEQEQEQKQKKYIGATEVASVPVVSKKNLSVPNPEGVSKDQWARYLKLRRDKHLPLTVEAFALLEREAKKAGLTTPQAIQLCLEHSWAGFKAEWMKKESSTQPESTVPTFGKVSAKQASFYGSKLAEIVHDKLPDRFRKGCQNWVDVANNIADAIMNDEQAFNGLIVPMLVKTGLAK